MTQDAPLGLEAAQRPERPPHGLGVGQPRLGRRRRHLHPPARARGPDRPGDPVLAARGPIRMAAFETHGHEVLIIGAGGAGLRAAIEAKDAGADVGLVCKSLLGKAHTVMAEGGVAAALGHVASGRLVAGPLPRHDGRWQVPQQPADGRAARHRVARPGARARAVGRGLRPDARRSDPPAPVRRSFARPAGARRRPDRAGDDPDPPGSRGRRSASRSTWSARSPGW